MKFQLKALAAAAILAAALPAHATIDTAASGNSSLILTVLDKVANVSASFDLGKNYSDFNQVASAGAVSTVTASGTSFSWDLANNADYSAAWTSFLAAATLPNIQYAITAGDNLGSGAGSRGFITTYVANGATLSTSGLITAVGNFDTYLGTQTTVGLTNHATVANGSAFQTPATVFYGSNKANGTGPTTVGAIGSSLGVVEVLATTGFNPVTQTIFGNGAQFTLASNGALSYSTTPIAAVPEADTWAMMLLGLGFMGFVARRKQA